MDWNEFCKKIEKIIGAWKAKINFSYDDDKISYTILSKDETFTLTEYNQLQTSAELYTFQPYSIGNNKQFESIIDLPDIDSKRHFMIGYEEKLSELSVQDTESKLVYSFQEVSNQLVWYIIKEYDENTKVFSRFPPSILERKFESITERDIFALIRLIIRLPFSVSVVSETDCSKEQLKKYVQSFLFNFAYNLDFVFKPITSNDELFPQRTFSNKRRIHNPDEIMAPQLCYKAELTEQYYMALASSDPFVKFIGFYHIMEHFYEDVYNEDIFESVKQIIQHPGFSSKRRKDIVKVVDIIKKKTRQSKEEFQGSELEALELTIKKFINLSELNNDLSQYSSTIIEHYKSHEVSFSNGDTIDLSDITNEKLCKKIAARIYKTRNALVHSKSNEGRLNERGMYKPFKDSQELLLEIPLMRYLAESIIINSATPL